MPVMHRTANRTVYESVSLSTPPTRMVQVCVWTSTPNGDNSRPGFGHCFQPVVAIESVILHRYEKDYTGDRAPHGDCRTHREFLEAGWDYAGCELSRRCVVLDFNDGLINPNDSWEQSVNEAYKFVCCYWPAEEDEARLKAVIEGLQTDAENRLRFNEEMRKRRAAEKEQESAQKPPQEET